MATVRKVKRKSFKEDRLVTYALKVSGYAQEHFNQVIIAVGVLIVAIAVIVLMANSRRSSAAQAQRQLAQGMGLYQQGDFEAAKATFKQLSQQYGGRDGVIAKYYTAECELAQRNHSEALKDFQAYLDGASKFPTFRVAARYGIGLCYAGLGNYAEAAAAMEQVVRETDQKDPRYLDAAYHAGEFFFQAEQREKAAEYFRIVADKGTGALKERANSAVAFLAE